jgi:hypothetical protein
MNDTPNIEDTHFCDIDADRLLSDGRLDHPPAV